MKYIRTTHHSNGTPKEFSEEADNAWHTTYAGFVGHMLHPVEPSTVDDIYRYIYEYCQQNHDAGPPLTHAEIEEALEILLKYGMAEKEYSDD